MRIVDGLKELTQNKDYTHITLLQQGIINVNYQELR